MTGSSNLDVETVHQRGKLLQDQMWGDGKMTWPSGEDTECHPPRCLSYPSGCQEYIGSLKKGVFHGKETAGMISADASGVDCGRRPCQTTGLRVRQHKRASQTTRVRQHRRASQTTPTRESDNRHARIRQQKRANMTTKDNEGNGFTGAKCKQQPKKEHGINKACGTAVGTLATCNPII